MHRQFVNFALERGHFLAKTYTRRENHTFNAFSEFNAAAKFPTNLDIGLRDVANVNDPPRLDRYRDRFRRQNAPEVFLAEGKDTFGGFAHIHELDVLISADAKQSQNIGGSEVWQTVVAFLLAHDILKYERVE